MAFRREKWENRSGKLGKFNKPQAPLLEYHFGYSEPVSHGKDDTNASIGNFSAEFQPISNGIDNVSSGSQMLPLEYLEKIC